MAAGKDHDQIIAAAAKAALAPIGFWRKGRSRLWLADNGFWLNLVEFQPSGWSKGSNLNVSAHWLWGLHDFLSFDYIEGELRSFIGFETPDQFAPLAAKQAADAAEGSLRLRSQFSTIEAVAAQLVAMVQTSSRDGRPEGWPAYHAAVALGLIGESSKSRALFKAVLSDFESQVGCRTYMPSIEHMLANVGDRVAFQELIERQINDRRSSFGLAPAPGLFAS